jgi:hypothetical protein
MHITFHDRKFNKNLAEEATALRDAAALDAERIAALKRDVAALTAQ